MPLPICAWATCLGVRICTFYWERLHTRCFCWCQNVTATTATKIISTANEISWLMFHLNLTGLQCFPHVLLVALWKILRAKLGKKLEIIYIYYKCIVYILYRLCMYQTVQCISKFWKCSVVDFFYLDIRKIQQDRKDGVVRERNVHPWHYEAHPGQINRHCTRCVLKVLRP